MIRQSMIVCSNLNLIIICLSQDIIHKVFFFFLFDQMIRILVNRMIRNLKKHCNWTLWSATFCLHTQAPILILDNADMKLKIFDFMPKKTIKSYSL